ncbi:MAG: sugar phosphate isomerase/epimerase family protein [Planctomycetaceae bacterium]
MFVCVSTECFPDMPLAAAMERLAELEFMAVELDVREGGGHLEPALVVADPEAAIARCSDLQRLRPVAISFAAAEGPAVYDQFTACCRLAKSLGVVTMVVEASELGTPFNGEIERLRKLVAIASGLGAVVGVKTTAGRMTQDAETTASLCRNVPGLGVTLDPSHFIFGHKKPTSWEAIVKYVVHVHLRDTRPEAFQVRIGQGDVEYGKLKNQLDRVGYTRALCAHLPPMEGVDQVAELRKMRLLLESLL